MQIHVIGGHLLTLSLQGHRSSGPSSWTIEKQNLRKQRHHGEPFWKSIRR